MMTTEKRKPIKEIDAKAYQPLLAFEKYLAQSSLQRTHADLIKIRTSQINGCAFCIDKHTREARQVGEREQRLYLLSTWADVTVFTEEEKAVLALTEEVTRIAQHGVSDPVYEKAISLLGYQYTTEVIMAIIAMNAWNRVGISTQLALEKTNDALADTSR